MTTDRERITAAIMAGLDEQRFRQQQRETATEFQREGRYFVIKLSDLEHAGLNPVEIEALYSIEAKLAAYRLLANKAPLQCVVVEHDWPEYEPTWQAIEARVRPGTKLCTRCNGQGTVYRKKHPFDWVDNDVHPTGWIPCECCAGTSRASINPTT